jgi:tetratricopeptide (TPR) repeat protein
LVAYARISQGHVYRAGGAFKDAMPEYLGCLRMARQIGIRRLEADALSELSRLALDLGDAENARRQAMAALRLSNELGLGLRKTHGLVVLGLATVRTGPVELGKSYLRQALRMAEAQGYWLRGHEIEHELEKLGEPPELSRVSRRGTM